VTHTPGVLAETTADLAFALILAARRRLGAARDSLHAVPAPVPADVLDDLQAGF